MIPHIHKVLLGKKKKFANRYILNQKQMIKQKEVQSQNFFSLINKAKAAKREKDLAGKKADMVSPIKCRKRAKLTVDH